MTTDELEQVGLVNYETFAFTGHMPKLNTANKEVQDYLIEVATYWIREFDIDAWRLDVANEVDHQFWKRFYKETTRLKEDFYILGEIWHSSQSWLTGDEFHAVMNYPLTDGIIAFFARDGLSPEEFVSALNEHFMKYRQQANEVMFNLLDSHDTPRILTICKGDKNIVKAALTFMFLQYGTPCIFYGTEIGLEGENDPDCRKCMVWDSTQQDLDMLSFTKQLIRLRKNYADIISKGQLIWHDIRETEKVIGFTKKSGDEEIICYFNKGNTKLHLSFNNKPEVLFQNLTQWNDREVLVAKNGFIIFRKIGS